MEKHRKGYSLLELLVVLVLILVIGGIIFSLLVKAFKIFSVEAGKTKKEIETSINTDVLAFDLKNAGYGINRDEGANLVLKYNPDDKELILHETINILDLSRFSFLGSDNKRYFTEIIAKKTRIYPLVDIDAAEHFCVFLDENREVIEKAGSDIINCNTTDLTDEIYFGFPIGIENPPRYVCRDTGNPYCCSDQHCLGIVWFLGIPSDTSSPSYPQACKTLNTKILYRTTTLYSGDLDQNNKVPVINCVADWAIWFGLGDNGTQTVKCWENSIPSSGCESIYDNKDLAQKLKVVKIYMLVQSSYTADPNYDFCKQSGVDCYSADCSSDEIKVDNLTAPAGSISVCLKHPSNDLWKHYRWKIIEITVGGFPNIPQ